MLSIIVAVSQNGVIGKDNKLLWNIKEDLKRFKEITSGHKIIMGRRTFESLPKVLPNRHHIVITRNKEYKVDHERVEVINSIENIIEKYKNTEEEVFVIGGAEIYNQILPYANKIYLTVVYENFEGDAYFSFDSSVYDWDSVQLSKIFTNDDGLKYKFITLNK